MICPHELARELSAFDRGEPKALNPRRKRRGKAVRGSRGGASDESAGSDHEGNGQTNHLVGGGRDSGHPRSDDETLARADETRRVHGIVFHEKLSGEHGIELSYTWVKKALQAAGLVKTAKRRGPHRKRRPRRPLPGMMLHIDASRHQWFSDERWHDLIVVLDDAT
jgi:hypothetical protein